MAEKNPVFFVGAGPGDPELITVRGQRLLREADLVIYAGSLVPRALVTGLTAEVHNSATMHLDRIISMMTAAWRQGKRVVRLHTGDPALYGAIREQMNALAKEHIPCRIVPGVSSVAAAAAALKAELTLPELSQTVIITRRAGRTPVPKKESIMDLARHRATMMILLSVAMIDQVVADLLLGGYPAVTPVAVVEKASWPEERIVTGTLAGISDKVRDAGIKKTAIICVGEVFAAGGPAVASRLYAQDFSHGCREAGRG